MATIIILMGSILGLVGGLTAYLGFDASFWVALSVWVAAGPASAMLVITAATAAPQRASHAPVLARAT
jgi:hypothetical protein